MNKLRRVSGEEAIRALERLGFSRVRQRGSHVVFKKQTAEKARLAALCLSNASWPLGPCEVSCDRRE